jgi:hypothetical protein
MMDLVGCSSLVDCLFMDILIKKVYGGMTLHLRVEGPFDLMFEFHDFYLE